MELAVIAGGKGTRFSKFSKKPKILTKFKNLRLIDIYLKIYKKNNFKKINFLLGHKSEEIINYLKKKKNKIDIIVEKKPLGTGGCLANLKFTKHTDLMIIMGDILTDFDVKKFLDFHKKKKADITLFVHPNDHPYDSDLINLGENNKVVDFFSKNRKRKIYSDNLATAGIYIIKSNILKNLNKNKYQDISKDIILKSIRRKKKVFAYKSADYAKDVGTPKRYFQTLNDLKSKKLILFKKKKKNVAIFLDRDGVLNKEKKNFKYSNPCDLHPGVINSLRKINKSKYLSIIISNQPAIAKGFVTKKFVENSHKKLQTILGLKNVFVNDIIYCPHHPERGHKGEIKKYKINCKCRKPKNGMIMKAKKMYNIDLKKSYFVGNNIVDFKVAKTSKIKPIIVNNKNLSIKIRQKKIFNNLNQFTNNFFSKKND